MSDEGAVPAAPNGNGMGALAAALARAQAAFPKVLKDRTAKIASTRGEYSYKYADLASLLEAVRKPLADNGLALTQPIEITAEGHMVLHTILLHTSGAHLDSHYPLAAHERPQEMGSEITYSRRYAAGSILGIASEDDDDGAAAQHAMPPVRPPFRGPGPKSNVAPELVGTDRPKGAPTTEADLAANFPKNDDEDRPFLLEACKRKVEEHKFVGWQRELLKKQFLDGHAADLAPTPKLRNLYLFLGDGVAVKQWVEQTPRPASPTPKAEATS